MSVSKSVLTPVANLIIKSPSHLPANFPNLLRRPAATRSDCTTYSAVVTGHIRGSVVSIQIIEANTQLKVVLKWAQTDKADTTSLDVMKNEASIYEKELYHLQGTIVPRCYGFYEGVSNDGQVRFACLLLEELPRTPEKRWTSTCEYHRHLMLAFCAIHKAGIQHNNVMDPRHFLVNGTEAPKIVSYSLATRHTCANCPLANTAGKIPRGHSLCLELQLLETYYGSKTSEPSVEKEDGRISRLDLLGRLENLGFKDIPAPINPAHVSM